MKKLILNGACLVVAFYLPYFVKICFQKSNRLANGLFIIDRFSEISIADNTKLVSSSCTDICGHSISSGDGLPLLAKFVHIWHIIRRCEIALDFADCVLKNDDLCEKIKM